MNTPVEPGTTAAQQVAALMVAAVRTAPKTRGIDRPMRNPLRVRDGNDTMTAVRRPHDIMSKPRIAPRFGVPAAVIAKRG